MSVGYSGSRSEHMPVGGTVDTTVNINQIDPQYLALGSALLDLVPNPFFGNAGVRQPCELGDHRTRSAAAAVPAVHRRARASRDRARAPGTTR